MKFFKSVLIVVYVCVFVSYCSSEETVSLSDLLSVPRIDLPEDEIKHIDRIIPSLKGEYFIVLKSGLALLVKEVDSPAVSCKVKVNAGSIYEEEYLGYGISHYLEHVVSGGTTSTRSEEENEKIESNLGGGANASTSYDVTNYFINTTPDHWFDAMFLLFSFVTDCQFSEREILREKPVILQEFKLGENSPNKQHWQLFVSTVFRDCPVKYPIIGKKSMFLELTRDDLIKYYNKKYQPSNMVVSVVGGINGLEVISYLINMTKDFVPKNEFSIPIKQEPEQLSPRWVEKVHPASKLAIMKMGFPTVSLMEPDLYPLDVLAYIMGRGRTSRLYRALRDEKRLVLSCSSFNWTPAYCRGVFAISANLDYKNVKVVEKTVWEEINKIKTDGVTQEELDRVKRKMVSTHIFGNQKVYSISENLAYSYLSTGDPHFDDRYVEGIKRVKLEDVKRVAEKYFLPHKESVAIIKPPEKQIVVKDAEEKEEENHSAIKMELSNGMKLILKNSDSYPIVDYRLFLKGGLRYEDSDKNGISRFMVKMLTNGTETKSKLDISKLIENIGGSLSSSSGANSVNVSCSVLSEDAYIGLDLMADIALNPSFPEEEIEKLRQETILSISKLDESWQSELVRYFNQNYFVYHPYKNDVLGSKKSIELVLKKDIEEFYNKIFVPENMVLAVYGNYNFDDMIEKIRAMFGEIPSGGLIEPELPVEVGRHLQGNLSVAKVSDKYSASIFFGFPGMTIYDEDRPAMDVLDGVLSGINYPGGWLHEQLRGNDKSLVYLVHAFPRPGIDGGYFGVMSQTTMENYDEVISVIRKNIDKISTSLVSDEELNTAKNMCITMRKLSNETYAMQAYSDGINEMLGLGYDYDQQYPSQIQKVTKDDVLKVAKKYFKNSLLVTVYPEGYDLNSISDKEND